MKTVLKSMIAFSFLILTCSVVFACGGDKSMSTGSGEGAAVEGGTPGAGE